MKAITASILLLSLSTTVVAQSNYKESSNSFAKYTKTGDFTELENAKKFIDQGYKTKRDSSSAKHNLLRAMVYSSLAYADSTRQLNGEKDHIDESRFSVDQMREKYRLDHPAEIKYVNQNLIAAFIYKANKQIEKGEFENAYNSFLEVEKLGSKSNDVVRNLAYLSAQAGKTKQAIAYYKTLISNTQADALTYISLAKLYKEQGDNQQYINTLQTARQKFLKDKSVLFLLVDAYADNKAFQAITPIIAEAIKHEPENIDLYYLAGYANENVGNIAVAKEYYQKVLELDEYNYDANLALGLIFLNEFLEENSNLEAQYSAQDYLLKANGIQPYAVNALQGLALYYETTDDQEQLDRVNTLLNQLSNN